MPEPSTAPPEVVRWYTRARKFPQLLGHTDGAKIPGGPYTHTQVIGGAVVLVLGAKTMRWWGHAGFIGNVLLLGGATAVVVFGLGRLPSDCATRSGSRSGSPERSLHPPQGSWLVDRCGSPDPTMFATRS